ncbi:hypothetical protein [Azospirillum rugosum]|uniref:NAD/NADP transhydrogenase beta subunit n=1 Tax=Azospirillum rugosum TaxID=416170 RepID=A0ABS4SNH4_9PROT|nr:hypothetical protein [Azospirillum rugosum]MBP2293779.1 NAD/NADP transhydrogenase beta subunit [Azospirillum rugosum]MDQ0527324.1 NAD/NADP transhydrogenase beta subunit [Azospirillum rugosum]
MELFFSILYLVGLASFMMGLHALPRPETERRGAVWLSIGVVSFAAVIIAGLIDHGTVDSVLELMAGLAIAMAAVVAVNQRVLKWRNPPLP